MCIPSYIRTQNFPCFVGFDGNPMLKIAYLMAAAAALEVYNKHPDQSTSLDLAQRMIQSCRSVAKQATDITASEGLSASTHNDQSDVFLTLQVNCHL